MAFSIFAGSLGGNTVRLSRLTRPVLYLAGVLAASAAEAQIQTSASHALIADYATGEVLFCKACDQPMPPSSMSKLMTVELVFQRIKDGRLKLGDTFHVSQTAWAQGQKTNESKMWVNINTDIKVDDLLKGIIVQSGGDACLVVAEALGGSEAGFADMLNARAKELGLTNSHFVNSSGLPDPEHYMSAQDLALLSAHVIRTYPELYHYFTIKDFTWENIRQPNRNTLINANIGVDGLKTGHTNIAGYGLVASALRNDRRLILVVNGLKSERERAAEGRRLFDIGYREFKTYGLADPGEIVGNAQIWGARSKTIGVTVKEPLQVILGVEARRAMKVTLRYDGPLRAPIAAGQQVGTLTISAPGRPDKIVPALASEAVAGHSFLDKMMIGFQALVFGEKA
jgi:serine-type D-Ala-D-Ala carboxypeptidase (penicillin-binding protein 5/6)